MCKHMEGCSRALRERTPIRCCGCPNAVAWQDVGTCIWYIRFLYLIVIITFLQAAMAASLLLWNSFATPEGSGHSVLLVRAAGQHVAVSHGCVRVLRGVWGGG